jgi:23S rRNA (adenine2503-C2)-methyltransferase
MKNISKVNLEILKQKYSFNFLKINKQIVDSKDETVKFLFELKDNKMIETVLMKYEYGYSVCISTQVGCNMGCKFCASGIDKKIRDLTPDEIILQFLQVNN